MKNGGPWSTLGRPVGTLRLGRLVYKGLCETQGAVSNRLKHLETNIPKYQQQVVIVLFEIQPMIDCLSTDCDKG